VCYQFDCADLSDRINQFINQFAGIQNKWYSTIYQEGMGMLSQKIIYC
jgi:hypothetical protein